MIAKSGVWNVFSYTYLNVFRMKDGHDRIPAKPEQSDVFVSVFGNEFIEKLENDFLKNK